MGLSANITASDTLAGDVELATNTEAVAVTSQALAVTPGNLAAVFAAPPALGSTTPAAVSGTTVKVGDGTAAAPSLTGTTSTVSGLRFVSTADIVFVLNGIDRATCHGVNLQVGVGGAIGWTASTSPVATADLTLLRDAASILAQRFGTSAQTWRVYNTFTDASNYERLSTVAAAAADFKIIPEAAGTGTLRGLQVGVSGGKLGFYGTTAVTKPAALTAADAATVDATYGSEESGVINNLRTRLNELESRLQSLGLLT